MERDELAALKALERAALATTTERLSVAEIDVALRGHRRGVPSAPPPPGVVST